MLPGIGIFGTGSIVKLIIPYLTEKGFKVEAIWGRTLSKAESLAKELGVAYYTNKIDNVLLRKDVNLIFILCSPNIQAQIAVKALGIGKHVVCDKPAGLSQDEAIKMVHAAQYYPSLISVINHSLRFLPAFAAMKHAIVDGYLGETLTVCDVRVQMGRLYLNQFNWLCDKTMGGGVLKLVGSHVIDLVLFLTGQKAVKVHGIVQTFRKTTDKINGIRHITSPDFCSFQMQMNGNMLVTVTLNSHLPSVYHQEVLICGSSGHLVVRGGDLYGYKYETTKEEVLYLDVEDLDQRQCEQTANLVGNVMPKPYVKGFFKMICSLKEAFESVEERSGWVKEPVSVASSFEDGLYVQAVIDALNKSNERRQWVDVHVITEEPDPNPLLSAAVRKTGFSL